MKLPRDISFEIFIRSLKKYGYKVTRQTGSHQRLTTSKMGEHHITVPKHNPIKIGTMNNILKNIANHFNIKKQELIEKLF